MISRSNAELGQALDILHKQSGLYNKSLMALADDGVINGVDLNALTYQENILDSPLIVTRAALYIYLNAMVRRHKCITHRFLLTWCSLPGDRYVRTSVYTTTLIPVTT